MKIFKTRGARVVLCGMILILFYWVINNFNGFFGAIGAFFSAFTPLLIGLVIAFFTAKPSEQAEKLLKKAKPKFIKKHAKGFGTILVYILLILIIAFVLYFIIPTLYTSIEEFVENLPTYYDEFSDFLRSHELISKFISPDKIKEYFFSLVNMENVNKWFSYIGTVASSFVSGFVSIVMSIYLLLEKDTILSFFAKVKEKFFNYKAVDTTIKYAEDMIDIFYQYLSGMFIDAIVMGTVTATVLSIFNVPYAIIFGCIVLVGNMIPFFGAIISSVILFTISCFTIGPFHAMWVLVFMFVLGQLDGNLVQPKILSQTTGISPLLVLLSVVVFGNFFGPIGLIIGVPLSATIRLVVLDYLDNKKFDRSNQGDMKVKK